LKNLITNIQKKPPQKRKKFQIIFVVLILVPIVIIWIISLKFGSGKKQESPSQHQSANAVKEKAREFKNLIIDIWDIKDKTRQEIQDLGQDPQVQNLLEQNAKSGEEETAQPAQAPPEETEQPAAQE
ncbi:hypothetical protein KJ912_04530, partial [Patescibacteria group bacterium]|nr:hypothetical protein [Patescibacteria group bacterium]